MTDVEWIAQVRKYAAHFGEYTFSQQERQRMGKFVRGDCLRTLHTARFKEHLTCNLVMTYNLMEEMEKGIVATVAAQLKGLNE